MKKIYKVNVNVQTTKIKTKHEQQMFMRVWGKEFHFKSLNLLKGWFISHLKSLTLSYALFLALSCISYDRLLFFIHSWRMLIFFSSNLDRYINKTWNKNTISVSRNIFLEWLKYTLLFTFYTCQSFIFMCIRWDFNIVCVYSSVTLSAWLDSWLNDQTWVKSTMLKTCIQNFIFFFIPMIYCYNSLKISSKCIDLLFKCFLCCCDSFFFN